MKLYIYKDEAGVDSLYAQIPNTNPAKGALSEKLRELFYTDVKSLDAIEDSFHQITALAFEEKIKIIQDYITNNENLIAQYAEIKKKYKSDSDNFVLFSTCFDTKLNCESKAIINQQLDRLGYLPFYKAPSEQFNGYVYQDSYYKTQEMRETKITMNLGIQKICEYNGNGITSHLATMIHLMNGHDIPLGVFGHIFRLTEDIYQIKPYAVWLGL